MTTGAESLFSARNTTAEKLVRDSYDWLPHRIAERGERYGLLTAKLVEEVAEAQAAIIGSPEFIGELADIVEVCYALGGQEAVTLARVTKKAERGGFDRMLVMRLERARDSYTNHSATALRRRALAATNGHGSINANGPEPRDERNSGPRQEGV